MGEISLRHIPDLSDASGIGDFSDSSFQIPVAARHTDDLLLADDMMEFFSNANDTLSTPAPPKPRLQPPLTLAELTPRSKPARTFPIRSSLRPRPAVATPHRANVAQGLSAALSEDLSPFRKRDPSFEQPRSPSHGDDDLLMVDNGEQFLAEEQPSLDPISPRAHNSPSQLSSGSAVGPPTSVPHSDSPRIPESLPSVQTVVAPVCLPPAADGDNGNADPAASSTACGIPNMPELIPTVGIEDDLPEEGKGKAPSRAHATLRRQLTPGGDKAKRKRVTPTAAAARPAKLKPLTASWARRLSASGKKTAPTLRRRPLQGGPPSMHTVGSSGSVAKTIGQEKRRAAPTDIEPLRSGGLADTLISASQSSQNVHAGCCESNDTINGNEGGLSTVPDTTVHESAALSPKPGDSEEQDAQHAVGTRSEPDYLTLSQLSPQKSETAIASSATVTCADGNDPPIALAALHSASGERQDSRPSPIRVSVKRAASPAEEGRVPPRKRGKTVANEAEPSSRSLRSSKPALQPSRAKNAPGTALARSGPTTRTRRVIYNNEGAKRVTEETTGKPLRVRAPGGQGLAATVRSTAHKMPKSTASCSNSSSGSRSGNAIDGLNASRTIPIGADGPPVHLPPAKTKTRKQPELTFSTSTRVRTRSRTAAQREHEHPDKHGASGAPVGSSSSHGHSHGHSRSHSHSQSLASSLALHASRRAEAQPTVPVAFTFATDTRAAERERFDEARRARERELERQAEERRRQRELEEEAEVREMRRRAVPKANEVPEWYAFAPRRTRPPAGVEDDGGA